MAPETYYFFFSITAVFVIGLFITNIIYFRAKDKTLIGNSYKPGTIEYEKLHRYSSNRSVIIASILAIFCIANLIFDVYRLLHLENQGYARFILIFAPALVVVITIIVAVNIHSRLGNGKYDKTSRKPGKNDD